MTDIGNATCLFLIMMFFIIVTVGISYSGNLIGTMSYGSLSILTSLAFGWFVLTNDALCVKDEVEE